MIVKLKNVRLAFSQNLFTAGAMAGDTNSKPTFSSTFLIKKDDLQASYINQVIQDIAKEKWLGKASAVLKSLAAENKICFKDGDLKTEYDGFDGCMFIKASNAVRPGIFDKDGTELSESSGRPYAGCYVMANVDIWAQDNKYGKRINAKLLGVKFYADGDAFVGSATSSANDFDKIDNGDDDLT